MNSLTVNAVGHAIDHGFDHRAQIAKDVVD